MTKKNEPVEITIDRIDFPNKSIGYYNEKKVETKNGIVGQRVLVKFSNRKKKKGRIIEVLEKSPKEIEAKCPAFGSCGGCTYQNIPYQEQLNLKIHQVQELLENAIGNDYEFLGAESSPNIYEYRNKMEFSFGDREKDGPLHLGLHERNSFYNIVNADECKIVDKDFNTILKEVLNYFRELNTSYYHKNTHNGVLRHLVVRKAFYTGEILLNLVTSSQNELDLTPLMERLLALNLDGKIKGFLHTINDSLSDVVKSDITKTIFGQNYITEKCLDLKFKISAFSFFQTNSLGAEKLYSVIRDFAGNTKGKIIYDLYCGTGTIAQIMSPIAKKVIGIEIVEEAVDAAKENAKLNNLNNCEFITGDVLEKVEQLKDNPDLIILDPPRDGIHPKAINKIISFKPKQFIYVSCKPTSLARDLPYFLEAGYKVQKVKCVDMFPHTPHVETCCLLKRL